MINPEFLVQGVLRGVLGGRRKRSGNALRYLTGHKGGWLTHPQTLMTAAGLAWGVFETLQQKAPGTGSTGSPGAAGGWGSEGSLGSGGSVVPPPVPGVGGAATTSVPDDALRLVRLAISAAGADGSIGEREHAAIVQQTQSAGGADLVAAELTHARPLAEIVAGVTDRAECGTLYVLAYTILRADEQVSGAERIYLAQLANLLGLSPQDVQALEKDVGERIKALGDQGQLGG